MLLFKPEHIPMILDGTKTVTRRFWKKRRAVPGSIHEARTRLFVRPFARLRIEEVYRERVQDISDEDVEAEGYLNRSEYFNVLYSINKAKLNGRDFNQFMYMQVWVVRFTLEEVCS